MFHKVVFLDQAIICLFILFIHPIVCKQNIQNKNQKVASAGLFNKKSMVDLWLTIYITVKRGVY